MKNSISFIILNYPLLNASYVIGRSFT